jgi:hypothetical protein
MSAQEAEAFRVAADLVNSERAQHLIDSTAAPAAAALFRVEQRLLARASRSAPALVDEADAVLGDYFLGRLDAEEPPGRNFTETRNED